MKKTVKFTETVLRDANQSLIATRMAFDEFEPILSELDNAGYYSLECWGGATFDSCLRYRGFWLRNFSGPAGKRRAGGFI